MLTILFIGLKLSGEIDWSWVWVLSPYWVSFIVAVIYETYKIRKKRKELDPLDIIKKNGGRF